MSEYIRIAIVVLLLAATPPALADDGHGEGADTAFAAVWHHYEALWRALAADSVDGVAEHAEGIREAADLITADFSLERAGLAPDADAEEAAASFARIAGAALDLAAADDLATAREAFYELSKPMVRLNEMLAGEHLTVVYCPMARKSWLQRGEEIVNPYQGKSMPGCGDVVSE
jgi:hypothetical protein